ncbi:MAG TPA: hypothetical protein VGP12_07335 [Nitrosospira sp.]|nr:hypothetical protein [Nitrosospira sp.]
MEKLSLELDGERLASIKTALVLLVSSLVLKWSIIYLKTYCR